MSVPPEEFKWKGSLVDETASGSGEVGPVSGKGTANVKIGETEVEGELDLEHLKANGAAKSTTASAQASGEVDTPIGDVNGSAHAEGPSVVVEGEASTSGIGGTVGATAGSAGASVDAGVLGGGSAEIGLKAELGFHVGTSTGVDLPIISIAVPTPDLIELGGDAIDAVDDLFSSDDGPPPESKDVWGSPKDPKAKAGSSHFDD
jgi:hypothetical protein